VAVEEQVAFVLIAGDLYDGDWQDWRTGLFFTEQAAQEIEEAVITILADVLSSPARHSTGLGQVGCPAARLERCKVVRPVW